MAAESARASLRREWQEGIEDPVRQREVLDEALGHIDSQLALLRSRRDEIEKLTRELEARRRRVRDRLRSVEARQLARLISPSITGITPPPTRGRPSTISTWSTLGRPISSPCLITTRSRLWRWER